MSQKTRKKSASKVSKKAAAASRGATKSRARTSPKGYPDGRQGLGCKILKKQKKRNAKQDCKNCRESDGFEGHCFEGRRQDCPEDRPRRPPPRPAAKPSRQARRRQAAIAAGAPRVEEPKKVLTQRQGFKTNEFVVYPAHGVGQILAIEEQEIAGAKLELFVINFMKDKMTLRVPTAKVANVGMRKLSEPALVKRALETLKGRARVKRTMWSRRAQEYEAKINSGDIVAIAEVVRDLYRSESQPEQSYSERQLYEAALDRLSREIAVVQHVTETEAVKEIESQLAKSPRRGAKAETGPRRTMKPMQMKLTATMRPLRTRQRKRSYRNEIEKSPVARPGFLFVGGLNRLTYTGVICVILLMGVGDAHARSGNYDWKAVADLLAPALESGGRRSHHWWDVWICYWSRHGTGTVPARADSAVTGPVGLVVGVIWSVFVLRMMLEKQYKDFRIALIAR